MNGDGFSEIIVSPLQADLNRRGWGFVLHEGAAPINCVISADNIWLLAFSVRQGLNMWLELIKALHHHGLAWKPSPLMYMVGSSTPVGTFDMCQAKEPAHHDGEDASEGEGG